MPTKQPCSHAHLGCAAKIPRNARDERQHQYNFHGLKQEFYHPETGQMLAIAKRLGGPNSLMNCFVEGCTVQQASMKSMTDHIGRHFGLRVSVDKKKATELSTRPQPSQPDLQPEVDVSIPLVVPSSPLLHFSTPSITLNSDMAENLLPDHMPRSITPITQVPTESQNLGEGTGVGRDMTEMHPFSASPTTTLSTTQALKPGDASLDDGELSEMHSLFSASSTPPGTLPPSETQALEPGDVSDDAERAEMNTEITAQQDEPPRMPSRANANIKPASSAFAEKAKTSYSLIINKPEKRPKGKNQVSAPVQCGRPVRGLGITCQRCSESFKADEEFKLQRHRLTHHCLSAEFKDQKTEERIGICFRVDGKLACSYNLCSFKDISASKLGDHMCHEHNRRRNVITEFTVSGSAEAHRERASEVAIAAPPFEDVSHASPPSLLPSETPPSLPTTIHGHLRVGDTVAPLRIAKFPSRFRDLDRPASGTGGFLDVPQMHRCIWSKVNCLHTRNGFEADAVDGNTEKL